MKKPKKATKDSNKPTEDDDEEKDDEDIDTAEEDDESEDGVENNSCIFVTDVASQDNGDNVEENPNHAFVEQTGRGFKDKNKKSSQKEIEIVKDKKMSQKTCNFFLQGRCHWGMSGRKPRKDLPDSPKECPYAHPRVCSKLLHHGDGKHTSHGCDGSNCKKSSPQNVCQLHEKQIMWKNLQKRIPSERDIVSR